MKMKRFLLAFLLTLICAEASAQFSVPGTDPGSLKWNQMETPNFRIIYPRGEDSLARLYGLEMEEARIAVSRSTGLTIGRNYRSKMPVILHSFNSLPNATVVWAPKRMDIYTVQDAYSPTPMPWIRHLALHEGRHASQMQFGSYGWFGKMHYVMGEMFAGSLAGIYPGPALLEGDAVVAETALTNTGRGQQAFFLDYLKPAFDCEDWRDFWKWTYGSQKYYAPDHYRSGYMLVAGTRVFFDDPLFIKEYFDRVIGKSGFFNLQKTVKAASGMKFRDSFRSIQDGFHRIWTTEADSRAPFMPMRQVTASPWRHSEYTSAISSASGIFSRKAGLSTSPELVRIAPDGTEKRIRSFSSVTGNLYCDESGSRIYWSETVPHWRWTLASDSRIRYIETTDPARIHNLTRSGRYFNPAPSPDGRLLSVTEYPYAGGSRLVLMDASDGSATRTIQAPDSLQFTESVWYGDRLFIAAISDSGAGIYSVNAQEDSDGNDLTVHLPPQPVEISTLSRFGDRISFLSDRTGVRELYLFDPGTGVLTQVTNTRYGIGSPFLNQQSDTLYFNSIASSSHPSSYRQGRMIYATAVKDLPMKAVRFDEIYEDPVARTLSRQETALIPAADRSSTVNPEISKPAPFNKHLPVIHSWAPVYFDYDNVDSFSSDTYYKTSSIGATALFQSLTGGSYGSIGYSYHQDPIEDKVWRHSAHLNYTCAGLLPVIEISADFGDRSSLDISRIQVTKEESEDYSIYTKGNSTGKPYFEGSLRTYLPINLSSGGLSRGIVPQIRYRFTNDRMSNLLNLVRTRTDEEDKETVTRLETFGEESESFLRTVDLSLRGYVMRPAAPSQTFPSLGIGVEAGFHTRPGLAYMYGSTAYLYSYGYLPGLLEDQGLRLSLAMEAKVGGRGEFSYPDGVINMTPRGFVNSTLKSVYSACSPFRMKVAADYSIPFLNLDWSGLSPMAYLKNLELTPFADWSFQKYDSFTEFKINPGYVDSDNLFSFGFNLCVRLGNFLWLPYDTRIGFTYAWNTWSSIDQFAIKGLKHSYFGTIFSVSL